MRWECDRIAIFDWQKKKKMKNLCQRGTWFKYLITRTNIRQQTASIASFDFLIFWLNLTQIYPWIFPSLSQRQWCTKISLLLNVKFIEDETSLSEFLIFIWLFNWKNVDWISWNNKQKFSDVIRWLCGIFSQLIDSSSSTIFLSNFTRLSHWNENLSQTIHHLLNEDFFKLFHIRYSTTEQTMTYEFSKLSTPILFPPSFFFLLLFVKILQF